MAIPDLRLDRHNLVGAVFEEFERELAELRRRFADQPRREMLRLFLIALEREELVSVGYRESLMAKRLASMPVDDDVRDIIRHALIWIWKDEEMHSIYIRGAILQMGSPRLKVQAFLTQAAGAIAGWASSALQHTRWQQAPLSRLIAKLITAAGSIAGKVPANVRQHLQYGPFRNFCLFNIDAEKTASLCWDRLVELAENDSEIRPKLVNDFRRVAEDERRHSRIFQFLADALDGEDRLVSAASVDSLVKQFRGVSEFFLPHRLRRTTDVENPLGSGQPVWVLKGDPTPNQPEQEKHALFRKLLNDADLGKRLQDRAEFLQKPLDQMRVVIKPTFMLGYNQRDRSPITEPSLIEELVRYFQESGCGDIVVIEGPNIYDRFYQNRSVRDVARYFEIESANFRLVDGSEEQVAHEYTRGMAQYSIAQTWKEADFRISFPKLRSHPIELALLSIGNIEWVGARCDEFLFIDRQANRSTAIMMLLDEFPPHFAILDGFENAPDGLVGIMGCAQPRSPRRFYAGADALAVDSVAARHLGIRHPHESSLLQAACHWFGGWPEQVEVVGIDEPIDDWRGPYHSEFSTMLSFLALPMYMLGSNRGALFVPEMDETAFPEIRKSGLLLRIGRQMVRTLLGLRLPKVVDKP